MRLLLDTHVFIWSFQNTKRLSKRATTELTNPENEFYVSIVSIWEMQIKVMLDKMELGGTLSEIVTEQIANGVQILNLDLSHAFQLEKLPDNHRDPFDRMLISQALVENMTVITADKRFKDYNVKSLW